MPVGSSRYPDLIDVGKDIKPVPERITGSATTGRMGIIVVSDLLQFAASIPALLRASARSFAFIVQYNITEHKKPKIYCSCDKRNDGTGGEPKIAQETTFGAAKMQRPQNGALVARNSHSLAQYGSCVRSRRFDRTNSSQSS